MALPNFSSNSSSGNNNSNGLHHLHHKKVPIDDDDEFKSKYQKHERRRRKHVQQVVWLVAALAFLLVCLVVTFSGDSPPPEISPPIFAMPSLPIHQRQQQNVVVVDGGGGAGNNGGSDGVVDGVVVVGANVGGSGDAEAAAAAAVADQSLRRTQFLSKMKLHLAALKEKASIGNALVSERLHDQRQRFHQQQQRQRSEFWSNSKNSIAQVWENAKANLRSYSEKSPIRIELEKMEEGMRTNRHVGLRFLRPSLLVPLPGKARYRDKGRPGGNGESRMLLRRTERSSDYFYIERLNDDPLDWEKEMETLRRQQETSTTSNNNNNNILRGPKVDYTKHTYQYPSLLSEPPSTGGYPKMETMATIMNRWPQDDLNNPPTPFVESLLHFNFSNPLELEMARRFRNVELPFKLYDIPELEAARIKWTDEYVSSNFDRPNYHHHHNNKKDGQKKLPPPAMGTVQESINNYFAFFVMESWNVDRMGLPPVRNNDWTFEKWAQHARYADHVELAPDQPHFYYQAGVMRDERYMAKDKWTFISLDLPSISSPTETFFVFHPDEQKGIQCRFGERGVTAATHYDSGRNMVAMITGAKRYILSPPRECDKLAIDTDRRSSIYRHSLLNFGYMTLLNDTEQIQDMSEEERLWLERASTAQAVDTVLKAGEVMYIPSHWFHYITSLQKSAQCNVRSGIDQQGTREFGGLRDVLKCDGS